MGLLSQVDFQFRCAFGAVALQIGKSIPPGIPISRFSQALQPLVPWLIYFPSTSSSPPTYHPDLYFYDKDNAKNVNLM